MRRRTEKRFSARWMAGLTALLLVPILVLAQEPPPPPQPPPGQQAPPPGQVLTPPQLDDLVAPVALYPDSLLSQILVASTYPLEIVEAQQWLQQNPNLKGPALLDAAKRQNWDPSIQALVVFPDVLARLNSDIRWTTDLGNAFLAQQMDVMNAVQRMRAKAEANGKLKSNPQQNVTTVTQNGQTAIQIVPANPDVVYIPAYNPYWVWGPPIYGVYPPLFYPGIDIGFTFGPGIFIGGFFGGWGGWGWGGWGWGWGPNWFGGTIILNNSFFHRFGFHDFHGGDLRGNSVWEHNPAHRIGVPYPNREVANRFGGGAAFRGAGAFRSPETANRGFAERGNFGGNQASREAPAQRFGSSGFEQHNFGGSHSVFGGVHDGGQTRIESDHGFGSMGGARSFGGFGGGGGGFRGGGGGGRR